jgi:putative pyruvate formate lyase activating enzyme
MKLTLDPRVVYDVRGEKMFPAYLELYHRGELARHIERTYALLESCTLCPRECGVNRLAGEQGFCRVGLEPKVASWNVHPWEEPLISGCRGSGTIFFSGCTGRCLFCQNYPISHLGVGNVVPVERLAEMMLELQAQGCHNVYLV